MEQGAQRRLLLVGWDGADWKVINPLLDAGKMPNMQRLVDGGVMGNLTTLYPPLSPMLWTSIATGKRPFKHGINGFIEPAPTGGVRPVTNQSRTCRAIWNMMTLQGLTSNVVGWWPSHPAEPINGVMVSNHYHRARAPLDKPWPLRAGTVHPDRLCENLADLRFHPQELSAEQVLPFVPEAARVDQENDKRLSMVAKTLAECTTVHNAATALIQLEPWDFMAVYYDAIDHFSHGFMRYHPPRMEGVSQEDAEIYGTVIEAAYRFHDAMLGVLLDLAGEDATVMLISDHGFHPDELRPTSIPTEPAGPAVQHRQHGIFVLNGPGIREDDLLYGASLLDITPTILTLYGLPVGDDMDGKPLVEAFEAPPVVETIPSWDDPEGEDGRHPPESVVDPGESRELLQHLVGLGYVDRPPENEEQAADEALRELRYNEARAYMDANRHLEAAGILETLHERWTDETRFGLHLMQCLNQLGRTDEARRILDDCRRRKSRIAAEAREKLADLTDDERDPADMDESQRRERRRLMQQASTNDLSIELLQAGQAMAEDDHEIALVHLANAELMDAASPALLLRKGQCLLALKRWDEAEESFRALIGADPQHVGAHVGLCRACLARRQNLRAAGVALNTVGLQFHNPRAHYLLGVALHRIGRIPRAVEALNVCVRQNPNFVKAHERLAYIYEKRIGNLEEARKYRELAEEARENIRNQKDGTAVAPSRATLPALAASDIDGTEEGQAGAPMTAPLEETAVVVTGLPRGGTSMIMQMLAAGGLATLTDDQRPPDEGNARGYFEYAPVKNARRSAAWLPEAKGRAVKIVAPVLNRYRIGAPIPIRVIFVERAIGDVVRSQRHLLTLHGRKGADMDDERLTQVLEKQMATSKRLLRISAFPTLYLAYEDCLQDPAGAARKINEFLDDSLDVGAMTKTVDPDMRRFGGDRKAES